MNLYRVFWTEAYLAFSVESGRDHLELLPFYPINKDGSRGYKTQAAKPSGAVKNSQKKHPEFTNTGWRVAKVEQYDYDKDKWIIVQKLEVKPNYKYRDYPASRPFQNRGEATTGVLVILGAFTLIAGVAYVTARRR